MISKKHLLRKNMDEFLQTTISETKLLLKEILEKNVTQSIYLEGHTGIGKTEMISQLASEMECELYDLRLSLYEAVDLVGFGIPNEKKTEVSFIRPNLLPPDDDGKYILFLDEFNQIKQDMQSLSYQLVLERKVGQHKLPKNCIVIAAGNKFSDKGIYYEMPLPLKNRFLKFNLLINFEEWYEYGGVHNIDWRILSFLKNKNEYLFNIQNGENEDNFPTPRNWFALSKIIFNINYTKNKEKMEKICNGLLGKKTALSFLQYVDNIQHIDVIEKITDKKEVKLNKNSSELFNFYLVSKFYFGLKIKDLTWEHIKNYFEFIKTKINEDFSKELMFLIINDINKIIKKEREDYLDIFTFLYEDGIFEEFDEILTNIQNYLKSK